MVGAEGFEPPTFCSQSRRATKLRYAPRLPACSSDHRPFARVTHDTSAQVRCVVIWQHNQCSGTA